MTNNSVELGLTKAIRLTVGHPLKASFSNIFGRGRGVAAQNSNRKECRKILRRSVLLLIKAKKIWNGSFSQYCLSSAF